MKFGSNAKRIHFDLPVVGLVTLSPAFSSCCRCSRLDFSLVSHILASKLGMCFIHLFYLFFRFRQFSGRGKFDAILQLQPLHHAGHLVFRHQK